MHTQGSPATTTTATGGPHYWTKLCLRLCRCRAKTQSHHRPPSTSPLPPHLHPSSLPSSSHNPRHRWSCACAPRSTVHGRSVAACVLQGRPPSLSCALMADSGPIGTCWWSESLLLPSLNRSAVSGSPRRNPRTSNPVAPSKADVRSLYTDPDRKSVMAASGTPDAKKTTGAASPAVRFASVNEEIAPVETLPSLDSLSPPAAAAAAGDDATAAGGVQQLKQLSESLQGTHLQERRMSHFAFEPVSLPASRVRWSPPFRCV